MNCKQGDLAIVVRSSAGNEGKVVTCVKYMGVGRVLGGKFRPLSDGEATWEIDVSLPWSRGRAFPYMWDSCLRPLRGNLTEDEKEIVKELYTV